MTLHAVTIPVIDILVKYIELGFAVLPIWGVTNGHCACPKGKNCAKSPGKHPIGALVPNGLKNATRDKALLAEWVRRYPSANWALCAGGPLTNGGFAVVVDVDPRNGGDESLQQIQGAHGDLPESWTQDSGGNGRHFIFRSSEPCASRAPAPGIEILGEGKYFLVYPSKHVSGNEYTWALGLSPEDVEIADAPDWVIQNAKGVGRPKRDGDTARETVLGEAFAIAGKLGVPLQDGSYAVECPWADEHSDNRGRGQDSSTVILPPAGGSRFGGFRCMHSHCSQRTWQDVRRALPQEAIEAGWKKYPLRAVQEMPPEPRPQAEPESDYEKQLAECKKKLGYKPVKNGFKLTNDVVNAITILSYDPRWKGILAYDSFSQNIRFMREPPWHPDDKPKTPFSVWTEDAMNCLNAWFRRYWGLEITNEVIMQAASIVARREAFNPLQMWLDSLHWDGVNRIDTWLTRYLGVEDTPYARAVGRKWLMSAVARAYRPGCKADHVLILEGPQGRGKSTALKLLTGEAWFSDTPIDIGNKDAYLSLRGKWVIELAELSSLRKADLDRAKAFFSSSVDTYRPPYGRIPADFPRQCVFAGTVNLDQYLSDETGNRRFWPVLCGILDLEAIRADRAQIWAETVAAFKGWVERGELIEEAPWWPSYDERELFESEQNARVVPDIWFESITKWLHTKEAERHLIENGSIPSTVILERALEIEPGNHDRGKQTRVGIVMSGLGWTKVRTRAGKYRGYAYKPPSSFMTAK